MERKEQEAIGKARVITHRGLEPSKPNFFSESSFEAFENHLKRGFSIEFDPNPTKDGIIVMHDATLKRPTGGRDERPVAEVTTAETTQIPLANGRIPTFDEVMDLIRNSDSTISALHLKARFQTPETLERIMEALSKHSDIFSKFIIFDVKPDTARTLKKQFPTIRLAPSVTHPYDIARYNDSVGGTLISVEEALALRSKGLIDGVWGDEWDTQGENGTTKQLYTPEFFEKLHNAGLFVALVTPELHGTSPGLYGGESHRDAKDLPTLMARIKQIKQAGADYLCTDYPEEVSRL
ncbi:MAG: hypothetical protein HYU80_02160 [Candidatus Blackburnbacteria bacterium]|nr:hypothetical protein [Candidatus Blackburnbacteria bacterium]